MSAWSVCRSSTTVLHYNQDQFLAVCPAACLMPTTSLANGEQTPVVLQYTACTVQTCGAPICTEASWYLQVVMRIRPPLQHGMPSWSKENCIHAVSGSTVAIAPPESSQGYKNGDRGQTYNFTRVFNEHTGQEQYFQSTAAPLVGLCYHTAVASNEHCSPMYDKATFRTP